MGKTAVCSKGLEIKSRSLFTGVILCYRLSAENRGNLDEEFIAFLFVWIFVWPSAITVETLCWLLILVGILYSQYLYFPFWNLRSFLVFLHFLYRCCLSVADSMVISYSITLETQDCLWFLEWHGWAVLPLLGAHTSRKGGCYGCSWGLHQTSRWGFVLPFLGVFPLKFSCFWRDL